MKNPGCLALTLLASCVCGASLPLMGQTASALEPGTPSTGLAAISSAYARDPQQPVDQEYTAKIKQYTTEPYFNSPLTDYLPASKTVPTPEKVLGDVSGAPNMLPYAEDVYKYFRLLAASTPRVNPLPWEKTELTPNLGRIDSTADQRPGLTEAGVEHLKDFVAKGGLLVTAEDTAEFAIDEGLALGVFLNREGNVKVVGSVLGATFVDRNSPVAWGYGPDLAVYSASGMAFTIGNMTVPRHLETEKDYQRPTGRGGPQEQDIPQGRLAVEPEALPSPKPWEATPLNEEEARNNPFIIPAADRPDVILRFVATKNLLLAGLLEDGGSIGEKPIVVDAHYGDGNVLLFATNPIYRGETVGSYPLVFNAILNFDRLSRAK